MFFDLPYAFACATLSAKQGDVASIRLWIVGTHEAKQGGLPCPIIATESPMFFASYHPVERLQYGAIAITDRDGIEAYNFFGIESGRLHRQTYDSIDFFF